MTKNRYAMNISIILGVSVVLLLFIFILVVHHRGIPDRVQQHRGALLNPGSNMALWIQPCGPAGKPWRRSASAGRAI